MSIIFSSIHPRIVVSRNEDGSYSWLGQYNGMSIKQAIPIDEGAHCVLLLDPDASGRSAFKNLLCIDVKGWPIWSAEPDTRVPPILRPPKQSQIIVGRGQTVHSLLAA